jgi:phenylalanyl-tRNA synthetase beta chain
VSSSVFDYNPKPLETKQVALDTNWVNNLIGINIPNQTIISILESLGLKTTEGSKGSLLCTIPSWRYYDINIREDLAEEIARVYGYSRLTPTLPYVNLPPEPKNPILKTESKIKNFLSCQGFNEIYNSSLISLDTIQKTELKESTHLKLNNALTEDYEYLRTSLVPSILQNIKNNQGKSEEPFYLFEISNIYEQTKNKLPDEISKCVITSTIDFRLVKGHLESLFTNLNLRQYCFENAINTPSYFLKENTAQIISNEKLLGFIGFIKPTILHHLNITSNPIVIEMDTKQIANSISENYVFNPISEFPEVVEQITISSKQKVGDIIKKMKSASNLINQIIYTNSYQDKYSFKITFSSPTKNLTQPEVNLIKKDIQTLFDKLN